MNRRETALNLLIAERDALNQAIAITQNVITGEKRRGRPAGSKNSARASTSAAGTKRKPLSAAARKRISAAQIARHDRERKANEAARHA